jgi:DNA/RNA-binding domain of Phe-tRNA-synthetase-like protein
MRTDKRRNRFRKGSELPRITQIVDIALFFLFSAWALNSGS